ncbi:unnamed protein product [Pseudo-nitzschia multistriata]|uniref:Glutaredoxin domain-containing protein n=1 Tax=Pseudo-nitzschia multistriata TaxID=183589 RepID=A0A448YZ64_9STRA|nr:unnamed protein product [Pseudo-nitzschia multistriata]
MGSSQSSATSSSSANMKDFINGQISANKIVVFSKSYCPYCTKTKQLFAQPEYKALNPVVHELDKMGDGPAIQAELLAMSGQRTVPSVWIGGTFLGGNSETQAAHKDGSLQSKLGLN